MGKVTVAEQNRVLTEVTAMIKEVMGAEFDADQPITLSTKFSADLELESIEFVVLAEKIQAKYGDKVKLIEWFSAKELDDMIALSVGELVDFILGAECAKK